MEGYAHALFAISSRRTDHEKAQYAWDYRWSRIIDHGARLASMVAKECGAVPWQCWCPSRTTANCDERCRRQPKGSPKGISPRSLLSKRGRPGCHPARNNASGGSLVTARAIG